MSDPVMEYQDKKFRESKIYFADNGMLAMFSYAMIKGSAEKALDKPTRSHYQNPWQKNILDKKIR